MTDAPKIHARPYAHARAMAETHTSNAESMLTACTDDGTVQRVERGEQAMVLRAAAVHATLALYWQGEARDIRDITADFECPS